MDTIEKLSENLTKSLENIILLAESTKEFQRITFLNLSRLEAITKSLKRNVFLFLFAYLFQLIPTIPIPSFYNFFTVHPYLVKTILYISFTAFATSFFSLITLLIQQHFLKKSVHNNTPNIIQVDLGELVNTLKELRNQEK